VLSWLAIPRRGWFIIPTAGRNTAQSTIKRCSADAGAAMTTGWSKRSSRQFNQS